MKTFRIGNTDVSVERFDQWYLLSAAVILGFTGLAKVPTDFVLKLCIEDPMLGPYQPANVSNLGLSGFAAGIELAIVALIIFSPVRWLPCLASASWGTLCLAVRFLFFKDGFAHCNCLGWIDAPPLTVAAIAAWLAVGGGIAFWQSWHISGTRPNKPAHQKVITGPFGRYLMWGIAGLCVFCGLLVLLNGANYDEDKGVYGPLYLSIAAPLVAIGVVAGIRGWVARAQTNTSDLQRA
jgi:hypothetical protein